MPPVAVNVILPFDPPLQDRLVLETLNAKTDGWLRVTDCDIMHPKASLKYTVCDPALSPVNDFGDVAAAYDPPSMAMVYGAVPPLNVAVIVPFVPPLQLIFVEDKLIANAALTVKTPEPLTVHPFESVTVTVYVPPVDVVIEEVVAPVFQL